MSERHITPETAADMLNAAFAAGEEDDGASLESDFFARLDTVRFELSERAADINAREELLSVGLQLLSRREDALRAGWARLYAWALVLALCAVAVILSARHLGLTQGP